MENKQRKEELTTEMHSEFIGDEIPKIDLYVMGVYGAIARGVTIEEALKNTVFLVKNMRQILIEFYLLKYVSNKLLCFALVRSREPSQHCPSKAAFP